MSIIAGYNDPLHIQWNVNEFGKKQSVEILNEPVTVVENKVFLSQIPDVFHRVQIQDYIEININDQIVNENEFKVDYSNGQLFFHESKEGLSINIDRYYGRGVIMYPVSRIWTKLQNGNVVQTLGDVIEKGTDAIDAYGGIVQAITDAETKTTELNSKIIEGNTAEQNLDDSILVANTKNTELNSTIDSANTTKTNLDGSITLAEQTKQNLDTSIANGDITNIQNDISGLKGIRIHVGTVAPTDTVFWLDTSV